MSKASQRIIVLNVKGSESALDGTNDMIDSVVEALQNQYPKLKVETTKVFEPGIKPFLMFPTKIGRK